MAFATIGTRGIQAQSVDLTSKVTGTLPVPNGGLGIASGTTGQFLKFSGTETLASASAGINQFDIWGLSSTNTVSSGEQTLTGWGRITTRSRNAEGSAMTESSGVFTFPTTGKWFISANFYTNGYSSTHYSGILLRNGDDENIAINYNHAEGSSPNWQHSCVNVQTFFDVTDTTSNDNKLIFKTQSGGARTWAGNSANGDSCALFIRLMDT